MTALHACAPSLLHGRSITSAATPPAAEAILPAPAAAAGPFSSPAAAATPTCYCGQPAAYPGARFCAGHLDRVRDMTDEIGRGTYQDEDPA